MSSDWGRIDADGTVYVRTADGERAVGSGQAGDAEAGLAYYMRHYDDLATEVTLLEQRLAAGAADPASTRTHATELKDQLPTAAAVGDLAALDARLAALIAAAEEKIGANAAAREQARADAIAAKEKLAAEAEQIAESGTPWKRFAAARDAFGKRRGQHFAQLDAERGAARAAKDKLIERAEELAQSSDWKETAAAMRDLMAEWKAAGRAGRDTEEGLWTRFRAAQDTFFARRSATFAERDAEQTENQRKKEAVVAETEALDISDPKAAQAALRSLQSRYDEIGHVPREVMRPLDDRMRAAEQRVRAAVDAEWARGSAASNPFLAELLARLAEAEAKLERAKHSGDAARIAKAEAEVAQRRSLIPE